MSRCWLETHSLTLRFIPVNMRMPTSSSSCRIFSHLPFPYFRTPSYSSLTCSSFHVFLPLAISLKPRYNHTFRINSTSQKDVWNRSNRKRATGFPHPPQFSIANFTLSVTVLSRGSKVCKLSQISILSTSWDCWNLGNLGCLVFGKFWVASGELLNILKNPTY